jgi:hypothetical protein
MATCPRCHTTWTGTRACHCGACHQTFSGLEYFDRHRNHDGPHGRCQDPADLDGIEFRNDMWRGPEINPEQRARVRAVPRETTAPAATPQNGTHQ